MSGVDWDSEHKESKEETFKALDRVREAGDSKKAKRRAAITVGTAAVAVFALFGVVGLSGGPTASPSNQVAQPPATVTPELDLVAQITAKTTAALADLKSISAEEKVTNYEILLPDYSNVAVERMNDYTLSNDGSFTQEYAQDRFSGDSPLGGKEGTIAYNSVTGAVLNCEPNGLGCFVGWGPAYGSPSSMGEFQALINQISQSENANAKATNAETWRIEFDTKPNMSEALKHVIIDVQQSTGIPVYLETTVDGLPNSKVVVSNLVINKGFSAEDIDFAAIAKANGSELTDYTTNGGGEDSNTSFLTSSETALPSTEVKGFTSKEFWLNENSQWSLGFCAIPAEEGAMEPTTYTATILEQVGRSGSLEFRTISLDRNTCPEAEVNSGDDIPHFKAAIKLESITATSGTMKGTTFDVYRDINGELHVGGQNDAYIFQIDGDLTYDQMKEAVNNAR